MKTRIPQIEKDLKGWTREKNSEVDGARSSRDRMARGIARQATAIRKDLGFDKITAPRNGVMVDLTDYQSIVDWFTSRKVYHRDKYVQDLQKNINLKVRKPTFEALAAAYEFEVESLKAKLWLHAWARERGYLLEWMTFLALARGAERQSEPRSLTLDSNMAPLAIRLHGDSRLVFVRYQAEYHEFHLGTKVRPDFSLTLDTSEPSASNLIGIVECKSTDTLHPRLVREIWSKGIALDVGFVALVGDGKLKEDSASACQRAEIDWIGDVLFGEDLKRMDANKDLSLFERLRESLVDADTQSRFAVQARGRVARLDAKLARRR